MHGTLPGMNNMCRSIILKKDFIDPHIIDFFEQMCEVDNIVNKKVSDQILSDGYTVKSFYQRDDKNNINDLIFGIYPDTRIIDRHNCKNGSGSYVLQFEINVLVCHSRKLIATKLKIKQIQCIVSPYIDTISHYFTTHQKMERNE